jgi:hypothetical protein
LVFISALDHRLNEFLFIEDPDLALSLTGMAGNDHYPIAIEVDHLPDLEWHLDDLLTVL